MKSFAYFLAAAVLFLTGCGREEYLSPPVVNESAELPLPSTLSRDDFQKTLYQYLGSFRYRELGWKRDKTIRDTGAWLNGRYSGTHPAVRLYYSPEVMDWLVNGRKGELPDGAVIIKEMYEPPAARYEGVADATRPHQWTVMIKDRGGHTPDGWYWSYYDSNPQGQEPPIPQPMDNDLFPFAYPNSDFGIYCVRCHVSAAGEMTFSDLANIEGYPGEPLRYPNDGTWKQNNRPTNDPHPNSREVRELADYLKKLVRQNQAVVNQDWLHTYDQIPLQQREEIQAIPGVTLDHVVSRPDHLFMTSDQCLSCHAGQNPIYAPNYEANMFIQTAQEGIDISPYTEWRWSMMGLAGRDPIFHAQMESEIALLSKLDSPDINPKELQNLCLRCHDSMGQRQFTSDFPGENFTVDQLLVSDRNSPHHIYGALARDGVSCMVCHQIDDSTDILQTETGKFGLRPRDEEGNFQVGGPYQNAVEHPMIAALKARPQKEDIVSSAVLCASCHTVKLPVMTNSGKVIEEKYEQATFFEWAASASGGTSAPFLFKSCQDCHMASTHPDTAGKLSFKIANIQDETYPKSFNETALENRTLPVRPDYRRHNLNGINIFALEMFRQFPDILGVSTSNFMSGVNNGLDQAIRTTHLTAKQESAEIEVLQTQRAGNQLTSTIKITNKVGHRFPSGVGFRRLFVELKVLDAGGAVVWGSGRTDSLGILIDENGKRLDSEFHQGGAFQPHFTTVAHGRPVTAQNQAQIYEELLQDSDGSFTTSFLRRITEVKDNRLLPNGYDPTALSTPELQETVKPHGGAATDPDFIDGTGTDTLDYVAQLPPSTAGPLTVEVKLFYQSIPPTYLKERFDTTTGPATRRLHFMGSHLKDTSEFNQWKLEIANDTHQVP